MRNHQSEMSLVPPIHDALGAVQQIRRSLQVAQRFKGWSGPVRALSGTLAVLVAFLLDQELVPRTRSVHVMAWGALFLTAMLLNLGALAYWFFHDRMIDRNPRRLKPMLDVIPPLFVGAVLTAVLLLHKQTDYLFGVWMCMFGLTNLASHYVLPPAIAFVGVFYIFSGLLCFFLPGMDFLNPWAMGLVFFAGEWLGGLILYADQRRYAAFEHYMGTWNNEDSDEH
jgi:hypothetical protein